MINLIFALLVAKLAAAVWLIESGFSFDELQEKRWAPVVYIFLSVVALVKEGAKDE